MPCPKTANPCGFCHSQSSDNPQCLTLNRPNARQRLGVRQPSAALARAWVLESGRGLPHSKTLARRNRPQAVQGFRARTLARRILTPGLSTLSRPQCAAQSPPAADAGTGIIRQNSARAGSGWDVPPGSRCNRQSLRAWLGRFQGRAGLATARVFPLSHVHPGWTLEAAVVLAVFVADWTPRADCLRGIAPSPVRAYSPSQFRAGNAFRRMPGRSWIFPGLAGSSTKKGRRQP